MRLNGALVLEQLPFIIPGVDNKCAKALDT